MSAISESQFSYIVEKYVADKAVLSSAKRIVTDSYIVKMRVTNYLPQINVLYF